jgi:guanine deaminase
VDFIQHTIDIARQNVAEGGRPFATVIVRDGEVLKRPDRDALSTVRPASGSPEGRAELLFVTPRPRPAQTEGANDGVASCNSS